MVTLAEKILDFLQFEAEITVHIFQTCFTQKTEARREFRRFLAYGPRQFKVNWADWYRKRRQFYNTLNYLHREKLIARKRKKGNSLWSITSHGIERLRQAQAERKHPFSLTTIDFRPPQGKGMTIVAFDIPEQKKRARIWIRKCLREMNFRILQKSVWMSKGGKVDDNFIFALRDRGLLDCVHIFSVNHQGTIREIDK